MDNFALGPGDPEAFVRALQEAHRDCAWSATSARTPKRAPRATSAPNLRREFGTSPRSSPSSSARASRACVVTACCRRASSRLRRARRPRPARAAAKAEAKAEAKAKARAEAAAKAAAAAAEDENAEPPNLDESMDAMDVEGDEPDVEEEDTDEDETNEASAAAFRHLAATVVQQAHLSPLPVAQAPVYWQHDHALWLYPAPHMVVLGDRTEQQASAKFEDTELVNPGCFADDGSFAVYRPATREVEFSAVPAWTAERFVRISIVRKSRDASPLPFATTPRAPIRADSRAFISSCVPCRRVSRFGLVESTRVAEGAYSRSRRVRGDALHERRLDARRRQSVRLAVFLEPRGDDAVELARLGERFIIDDAVAKTAAHRGFPFGSSSPAAAIAAATSSS